MNLLDFFSGVDFSIFGSEFTTFIILLLASVLVGFGSLALNALAKNEKAAQYLKLLDLIDDTILSAIVYIERGGVAIDQSYYDESQELAEQENYIIDPRMLYLLDAVQDEVKRRYGVKVDFVDLHRRAERIFQDYREITISVEVTEPIGTEEPASS